MFTKLLQRITASKLQNRFILFFIILASVPLLVLGGVSLYLIDLSHRYDVSNLELQLIDQKIEEINKFFSNTLGVLELKLALTETREAETAAIPWQQVLAKEILQTNSAFEEVSFIDLQGIERAKELRSGVVSDLTNISNLPKFKEALAGKNYISEVYYTLSGPAVTLSAPVRVGEDIIQVLSAEVRLSSLSRSVEAARLGSAGYLTLIDRDGRIIASGAGGDIQPGFDMSRSERVRRVMAGVTFDGLGTEDRYQSLLTGLPVVGAARRIPGIEWGLLAEWPIADADAIVRDVSSQVVRVTLFSIIAVLFLASLFAARFVNPIKALEAGVAKIEEGKFDTKVEIKTRDELEELGGAFNKMAQGLKRLQELKNEFVFIAAHELRTPVTAIKGYLSLVFEGSAGAVPEKVRALLETVNKANERLIQLVNDILEIARSEAGRITIQVVSLDIRERITAILSEVKPLADEKRITVSYDASVSLPRVRADSARVAEVLMNLVSNAIKYNNTGGWVKVYHEWDGKFVTTHVEDNGFGMSPEDQAHIFEKFFRSQEGKIKDIQGTGLGLFITKELVEKMGGKIWFRSESGKGTRFSFSLPNA